MNILSPRPFNSKIRKKMLRGTIYHDYIENLITKNNNNIISEKDGRCKLHKEYNNKYTLYGRCDLIILGLNNKNIPIEIKSFDDKWGTKYIPNSMHELQLQMYMDIINVDCGYLCYISQNFDDYWYKIDRNDKLINEIINKYDKLSDNLKNKIIPEKIKSWECSWCKYKIDCVFE